MNQMVCSNAAPLSMPASTPRRSAESAEKAERYSPQWDYSQQARYYHARPNYAPRAIDALVERIGFTNRATVRVADIGAGTGNLAALLAERGFRVFAIEPNLSMMAEGLRAHAELPVFWKLGDAERTGLETASMDWLTFGSSFGTADRGRILEEVRRVLVPGGWFTCMWNHRDLERDPMQARVEQIIRVHYAGYSHGVRREDQRPVLERSGLFDHIDYIEEHFTHETTIEQYQDAWRSVKNNMWDMNTAQGRALVERILADIANEFGNEPLRIPYTTRIWTARRQHS